LKIRITKKQGNWVSTQNVRRHLEKKGALGGQVIVVWDKTQRWVGEEKGEKGKKSQASKILVRLGDGMTPKKNWIEWEDKTYSGEGVQDEALACLGSGGWVHSILYRGKKN